MGEPEAKRQRKDESCFTGEGYRNYVSEGKERAEALKNEGKGFFSRGLYPTAAEKFTEAIQNHKEDETLYANRAACYCHMKEYLLALNDANCAILFKPDWSRGYSRKGAANMGLEHYEDALKAFKKAAEVEPSNPTHKKSIKEVEDKIRERKQREEELGTVLDQKANFYTQQHAEKGNAAMNERRYVNAASYFDKCTKAQPNNGFFWMKHAFSLLRAGKFEDNVKPAQRAVELNSKNWQSHALQAVSLYQHREYAESAEAIRRALNRKAEGHPLPEWSISFFDGAEGDDNYEGWMLGDLERAKREIDEKRKADDFINSNREKKYVS